MSTRAAAGATARWGSRGVPAPQGPPAAPRLANSCTRHAFTVAADWTDRWTIGSEWKSAAEVRKIGQLARLASPRAACRGGLHRPGGPCWS